MSAPELETIKGGLDLEEHKERCGSVGSLLASPVEVACVFSGSVRWI